VFIAADAPANSSQGQRHSYQTNATCCNRVQQHSLALLQAIYAIPSTQASAPHRQCCIPSNNTSNMASDDRRGSGSLRADRRRRQVSIDIPTGVFCCSSQCDTVHAYNGQPIYVWLVLTTTLFNALRKHWTPPLAQYLGHCNEYCPVGISQAAGLSGLMSPLLGFSYARS
jgi:hypothetical protein